MHHALSLGYNSVNFEGLQATGGSYCRRILLLGDSWNCS
ncbi:unnamed protein product [Brassica oleracea]